MFCWVRYILNSLCKRIDTTFIFNLASSSVQFTLVERVQIIKMKYCIICIFKESISERGGLMVIKIFNCSVHV